MHIAVSLLTLFPGRAGGAESYVRGLAAELVAHAAPDRVTFLVSSRVGRALAEMRLPIHHVTSYRTGDGRWSRLGAMTYAGIAPATVSRDVPPGIDVVHYPVTVPIPRVRGAATVVTLHDVLHHELPGSISAGERAYRRLAYDRAARRADHVITVSAHARAEIVARLGVSERRVTAIPHGVNHARFRPEPEAADRELDLPERFLLYPANAWPHKNHDALLRAFAQVADRDLHLVLTGQTYGRELQREHDPRVHELGHVPFESLPALYRRATALVFPSLFEGFGLPLLEAMACGCPVAASDRGAIAETCGNAALLFDPGDTDAIGDAIRRVTEDASLRARLRAVGLERAASFRWDRVAARHLDVYRSVASSG